MPKRYSWGLKSLDDLTGGIESGYITTIYGPSGAGKTTLSAYIPSMRVAKELKEKIGEIPESAKIIVMVTDGGFALERARQIWKENGLDPDEVETHLVYKEFTELAEQHDYIKGLMKTIKTEGWKPVLITLDPICTIYRGQVLRTDMKHRGSVVGQLTGKMDFQMVTLRKISADYDCPCFITSWPPSQFGEALGAPEPESPMIGGRQTIYLSKVVLELSIPKEGAPEREVLLVKHRSRPVGVKARFKLVDKGIDEA